MAEKSSDFWEQREQVERFAAREADLRLRALAKEYRDPRRVRVLDLGCAAGRNTVFLAARGFDLHALDSSEAMVRAARAGIAPILGRHEARARVRQGAMSRLPWARKSFDLVVALGIYHCAQSRSEWDRALSESSRVLKTGGRLLVSVFTPETDLTGEGNQPVPGEPHLYEGFPGGRSFLVDAATLDFDLARHRLVALAPTETVRKETEVGRRVSANGLYEKRGEEVARASEPASEASPAAG